MPELLLEVPGDQIVAFLQEAQTALLARRMTTAFGRTTSTHAIFMTIGADSNWYPAVVQLEVRQEQTKKAKANRVYLTGVRAPDEGELVEGNFPAPREWPLELTEPAWEYVADVLRRAVKSLGELPTVTEPRRGYLAYYGTALSGPPWAAGWHLAPPNYPDPEIGPGYFGERMVPARGK